MTDLIFRLIEFLTQWFWTLSPVVVCGDDRCGVIRRRGIYVRDLRPGFNWKIPILDTHLDETCALDSATLHEQSLTASDGLPVTLRGVLAHRVVNPRKYILDCATVVSVINDIGCCVIAEVVTRYTAAEVLTSPEFVAAVLADMKKRARKWGIEVYSVGFIDRVQAQTYRILGGGNDPSILPPQ